MIFFARTRIVQAGAVAAAALLAAAAAPLQAATADQLAAQQRSPNANSERRICAMVELTGSRVVRRICRTQAEWDRAGGVPGSD